MPKQHRSRNRIPSCSLALHDFQLVQFIPQPQRRRPTAPFLASPLRAQANSSPPLLPLHGPLACKEMELLIHLYQTPLGIQGFLLMPTHIINLLRTIWISTRKSHPHHRLHILIQLTTRRPWTCFLVGLRGNPRVFPPSATKIRHYHPRVVIARKDPQGIL